LICPSNQLNGIAQLLNDGNRLLIIAFSGQHSCSLRLSPL
jgi:hypothetical protein